MSSDLDTLEVSVERAATSFVGADIARASVFEDLEVFDEDNLRW